MTTEMQNHCCTPETNGIVYISTVIELLKK